MAHGGSRVNSGRKSSSSPYNEKTSVIRVPLSIKPDVLVYLDEYKKLIAATDKAMSNMPQALPNPPALPRPIYSGKVSAGMSRFASPAQDYEQKLLDLNERYVTDPPATFYFEVEGNSMQGVGIFHGDTLIVNRAAKYKSNSIVVAALDGEWMCKRYYKRGEVVKLLSENPDNPPITLSEGQELLIFGKVTYVIHEPE